MQHFVFVKKALRTQSTKNCVTVVQKYKDWKVMNRVQYIKIIIKTIVKFK